MAAKLAKLPPGRPSAENPPNLGVSVPEAAKMLNVGRGTVESARRVQDHATPALIASVEAGAVSVSAAAEVAKLPEPVQVEIVEGGPVAIREAAKNIRAEINGRDEYVGADPLGYVVSLNLKRRHLSESQRAAVAARLAKLPPGRPRADEKAANLPGFETPAFTAVSQARAATISATVEAAAIRARLKLWQEHPPPVNYEWTD